MKKVWIDTDPGVDDTLAIAMLLESVDQIEIIGVSGVFGNATVEHTTRNAKLLMEAAGKPDIPVAKGAHHPLIVPLDTSPYVHGENGLGNMPITPPITPLSGLTAPQAIIDAVLANPGEISLFLIGPLTNAALALILEPAIIHKVKDVVIMGGAVRCPGNITPVAEANFYHDPHAAQQVLSAGWKVSLAPLDVDNLAFLPLTLLDEITQSRKPLTPFLAQSLPHYLAFLKSVGYEDQVDFPDALAAAYVLQPELFKIEAIPLFIETEGSCQGQSVPVPNGKWYQDLADERTFLPDQSIAKINVMLDIDRDGLTQLITDLLT